MRAAMLPRASNAIKHVAYHVHIATGITSALTIAAPRTMAAPAADIAGGKLPHVGRFAEHLHYAGDIC